MFPQLIAKTKFQIQRAHKLKLMQQTQIQLKNLKEEPQPKQQMEPKRQVLQGLYLQIQKAQQLRLRQTLIK